MIRLAVRCRAEQADLVLAELAALAPNGVEERRLEGGDDGAGGRDASCLVELAIYGAPGEIPDPGELEAVIGGRLVEIESSEVPGGWEERWREFHRPVVAGGRIRVRPPWFEPHHGVGLVDVVIDPGRAFGTGAHATTRLCLEAMIALAASGAGARSPFADLGTGSGVLAIAAAKLGWDPVRGLDNDAAAIEAAGGNARANGVGIGLERADLRAALPRLAPVTVANLTAPVLVELAGFLGEARAEGAVAPPQALICSGVLPDQAGVVAAAFEAAGFEERERATLEGWSRLTLAPATGA